MSKTGNEGFQRVANKRDIKEGGIIGGSYKETRLFLQ
jgi:hypothetical protein